MTDTPATLAEASLRLAAMSLPPEALARAEAGCTPGDAAQLGWAAAVFLLHGWAGQSPDMVPRETAERLARALRNTLDPGRLHFEEEYLAIRDRARATLQDYSAAHTDLAAPESRWTVGCGQFDTAVIPHRGGEVIRFFGAALALILDTSDDADRELLIEFLNKGATADRLADALHECRKRVEEDGGAGAVDDIPGICREALAGWDDKSNIHR